MSEVSSTEQRCKTPVGYLWPVRISTRHIADDHAAGIYALATDGTTLYSGSADKHVAGWDLHTGRPSGFAVRMQQAVYSVGHLPESNTLLVGNAHGGFHVIDLNAKREVRLLQVHKKGVFDFCRLPEGRLAVIGGEGSLSVWDEQSFELIRQIPLSGNKLRSLKLVNEDALTVCDTAGPLHLLDATTLQPITTFKGHERGTNCVAAHPSKPTLISGGRDAHLRVWSLETHDEVLALPAHNFSIYALAFSPDGTYLATASFDKTVKIWDTNSLELLARLERPALDAHRASVNALVWAAKDHLITAGDDKRIIHWHLEP